MKGKHRQTVCVDLLIEKEELRLSECSIETVKWWLSLLLAFSNVPEFLHEAEQNILAWIAVDLIKWCYTKSDYLMKKCKVLKKIYLLGVNLIYTFITFFVGQTISNENECMVL